MNIIDVICSACSTRHIRYAWFNRPMAQPHKGDRGQLAVRVAGEVYERIKTQSAVRGISMSQFCADVLALYFERPDLVRELDTTLPLFGEKEDMPIGA